MWFARCTVGIHTDTHVKSRWTRGIPTLECRETHGRHTVKSWSTCEDRLVERHMAARKYLCAVDRAHFDRRCCTRIQRVGTAHGTGGLTAAADAHPVHPRGAGNAGTLGRGHAWTRHSAPRNLEEQWETRAMNMCPQVPSAELCVTPTPLTSAAEIVLSLVIHRHYGKQNPCSRLEASFDEGGSSYQLCRQRGIGLGSNQSCGHNRACTVAHAYSLRLRTAAQA